METHGPVRPVGLEAHWALGWARSDVGPAMGLAGITNTLFKQLQ